MSVIKCPKCGQEKEAHATNTHLCVDCVNAENSRVTFRRQHQYDWIEAAKEAGVDLWLMQPGETQWEYTVWCAYRDAYPGKKPSYRDVAVQLNTTYNAVSKIAQRWTFQARMQEYIRHCDTVTMVQRRNEILDMNKAHVDMASKLRDKIATAIDALVPETLEPKDINSLAKLASELERKARVDTMAQEELRSALTTANDNPNLKKQETKQSDLAEVVDILMKSGALGDVTKIGVQTKTVTTLALGDDADNVASITVEEGDDNE